MKSAALWAAVSVIAVALAGCSDSAGDGPALQEDAVDKDSFQLETGKGAIAGLLVDDRFRPIDLTDDPQTEFQAEGFILLQETGEQVQTNENGEFTFVDLDPGQYTLRVTASGHETTPQDVRVTEGVFAEATTIARRVTTETNTILTEEFSVFIPCAFAVPGAGLVTFNCVLDLSGDSFRSSVDKNYTIYEDLSYVVAEVKVQNAGNYAMPLRDNGLGCPCYARDNIEESDYGKAIVANDPDEAYQEGHEPWTNDKNLNIGLFYAGEQDTPAGGAGATTGVQADFLVSLFLGEPEVDLETYCVLCE